MMGLAYRPCVRDQAVLRPVRAVDPVFPVGLMLAARFELIDSVLD